MGRAAAASKKSRFVHRTTDTPYVARHAAKGRLSVVAVYLVYRVSQQSAIALCTTFETRPLTGQGRVQISTDFNGSEQVAAWQCLRRPRAAEAGSAGWGALVHTPGEGAPAVACRSGAHFGVLSLF